MDDLSYAQMAVPGPSTMPALPPDASAYQQHMHMMHMQHAAAAGILPMHGMSGSGMESGVGMQSQAGASVPTPSSPSTSAQPTFAVPTASAPGPIRKRRFSSAKIQPTRVKKVMQSDEEIGRMVASVPVAIGRAMEHFAEKLLQASALAVANSTGRTLAPQHMKQAMLANPHFGFLEPVLRGVGMPTRAGAVGTGALPSGDMSVGEHLQQQCSGGVSTGLPFTMPSLPSGMPCMAGVASQQTPLSALHQMAMQPPTGGVGAAPVCGRRGSQGKAGSTEGASAGAATAPPPDGQPRKRGRPRKLKKSDKCVDDDLSGDVSALPPSLLVHESNGNNENGDKDRALMPPPSMPIIRKS